MALTARSVDSDRATETLEHLTSRPARLASLTRGNVDDLLWAIRQINERNAVVADALAQNDSATLSVSDIDALEHSHNAVRQVYAWVANAADATGAAAIKANARTLSTIASEANVTLRALRHLNPDLDDLRADDPVPDHVDVLLPDGAVAPAASKRGHRKHRDVATDRHTAATETGRRSDGSMMPKEHRRSGKSEKDRRAVKRSTTTTTVKMRRGECLHDVAEDMGVTVVELREQNPALERYDDDEPMPKPVRIVMIEETGSEEDEEEDEEVDSFDDGDDDATNGNRRTSRSGRAHGEASAHHHHHKHTHRTRRVHREETSMRGLYRSKKGENLRAIADKVFMCTLPRLRVANPELNAIGDYAELPLRTNVYREPPSTWQEDSVSEESEWTSSGSEHDQHAAPKRRGTPRRAPAGLSPKRRAPSTSRPAHARSRSSRTAESDDTRHARSLIEERNARDVRPAHETSGRESINDLARTLGVSIRDLHFSNPQLRKYNPNLLLPRGIPVYA